MVTFDKIFFSVEFRQNRIGVPPRSSVHKIAEYIHLVTAGYQLVPVFNKGKMHFINIGKGALAMFDDIVMAKMGVCGEKYHTITNQRRIRYTTLLYRSAFQASW